MIRIEINYNVFKGCFFEGCFDVFGNLFNIDEGTGQEVAVN